MTLVGRDRLRGLVPVAGALCALALSATGCAFGGSVPAPPPGGSTPSVTATASDPTAPSPPSVGPRGAFWLAVLEVAAAPEALDEDTRRLAPLLGGALVVSPVACFAPLPPAAGTGYLLGAAGPDRTTLEGLLSTQGLTPRFVVRTRSGCVD